MKRRLGTSDPITPFVQAFRLPLDAADTRCRIRVVRPDCSIYLTEPIKNKRPFLLVCQYLEVKLRDLSTSWLFLDRILHFTELKVSNRFIFALFILGSCTPYNLLICYKRKRTKLDMSAMSCFPQEASPLVPIFSFPFIFYICADDGQLKRPKHQLSNLMKVSN